MRAPLLRLVAAFFVGCLAASKMAGDTIEATSQNALAAWSFVGRDVAALRDTKLPFTLDFQRTEFVPFLDRRKSGSATIDADFAIDHGSFLALAAVLTVTNATKRVEIVRVSGRFTEDQQAEQRTPAFWVRWTCRVTGAPAEFQIEGFAFGPRYNNLVGPKQERRDKMLESASVAYTAATYAVLAKLRGQIQR